MTSAVNQGTDGGGLFAEVIYQVVDHFDPPKPYRIEGVAVAEHLSLPPPAGCDFGGGNATTGLMGRFKDHLRVPALCVATLPWYPIQKIQIDTVQRCNELQYLLDQIKVNQLQPCP